MKLEAIYNKIDSMYPKRLSDEYLASYGGRDNSGILIDTGKDITSAVFSLDFSMGAVDEAVRGGAQLIVTHHPAIFFPVANVLKTDPLGARLVKCLGAGISVISMHLNLDCAPGGIDESLARAAGCMSDPAPEEPVSLGGYGRIYDVPEQSFGAFAANLKKELRTDKAFLYGKADEPVRRIASFCGAGADAKSLSLAAGAGADVIVSADIRHNIICDAVESGIKVVQLTHYASENYGFNRFYHTLKDVLGIPCVFHEDPIML